MTDKDLALVECLSKVLEAISAVHVECVATNTDDMTRDELFDIAQEASKSVSDMYDSFNDYIAALKAVQNG